MQSKPKGAPAKPPSTFELVNSGGGKDSGIHFFNSVKWILIVLLALAVGGSLLRRLSQQQAENPRLESKRNQRENERHYTAPTVGYSEKIEVPFGMDFVEDPDEPNAELSVLVNEREPAIEVGSGHTEFGPNVRTLRYHSRESHPVSGVIRFIPHRP